MVMTPGICCGLSGTATQSGFLHVTVHSTISACSQLRHPHISLYYTDISATRDVKFPLQSISMLGYFDLRMISQ